MSAAEKRQRQWLLVGLVLLMTIIGSMLIGRWMISKMLGVSGDESDRETNGVYISDATRRAAIPILKIATASKTIEVKLPTAAFALNVGESISPMVNAQDSGWTGELAIPIPQDFAMHGRVGMIANNIAAEMVIDDKLHATLPATSESSTVWSDVMTFNPLKTDLRIRLEVEDTYQPISFRAVWQPEDLPVTQPFPIQPVKHTLGTQQARGLALIQQLNCASCHPSENENVQSLLAVSLGPDLQTISQRLQPSWVRSFLHDEVDDGYARFRHGEGFSAQDAEDITHFLFSLGNENESQKTEIASSSSGDAQRGRVLYHTIGCVACHGAHDEHFRSATLLRNYLPIGHQSSKWQPGVLAAFLKDPLQSHSSGRMPSLSLTTDEANDIAEYLLGRESDIRETTIERFELDETRIERGRAMFIAQRCNACHALPGVPAVERSIPFDLIAASPDVACRVEHNTSELVADRTRFAISESDQAAMQSWLRDFADRKSFDVPFEQLQASLIRLDCLACHETPFATGGIEPALWKYAETTHPDMPQREALPPSLHDAGQRLQQDWMHNVLVDDVRARPYLLTRMPNYGVENIVMLSEHLRRTGGFASGLAPLSGGTVEDTNDSQIEIGRQLVGIGGLNCLTCHGIAGHPSAQFPGVDLADTPKRLRRDAFEQWLADPQQVRPGTRMPTFFVDGKSPVIGYYDGDAKQQIEAIWAYLEHAWQLDPPPGTPKK